MLIFKEPLHLLSDHGWSAYRLIKEKKISNGTIMQLRSGKPVTTETIETICQLCGCQPNDIMYHVDDEGSRE